MSDLKEAAEKIADVYLEKTKCPEKIKTIIKSQFIAGFMSGASFMKGKLGGKIEDFWNKELYKPSNGDEA